MTAACAWWWTRVGLHAGKSTMNPPKRGERTRRAETPAPTPYSLDSQGWARDSKGGYMPRRRVGISGAAALRVSDALMEQQALHEKRVEQLDQALRRILRERVEHARAAEECREAQLALTREAVA